eukprot:TRINITY_DN3160_c0_g1_i1.p1 TRINITY_DN3160_c0_g1~~TRINITY_DN3160_c0_g1_i1.p1  ORF type:complete len:379 (+),score=46.68 TRINITY_DN3160_c0_g1_i1:72-1208(+)
MMLQLAVFLACLRAIAAQTCTPGDAVDPAMTVEAGALLQSAVKHSRQTVAVKKEHDTSVAMQIGVQNRSRRAKSCDNLIRRVCLAKSGCGWSGGRCGLRIAWLHVMKTGGSFGTTLAHYANVSLPKTAHIPSGVNESDPEDTIAEGSQGEDNFFKYKYPVEDWFNGVFLHPGNPGNHIPIDAAMYDRWRGSFVGLFRQPERRVLSAWHHFGTTRTNLSNFALEVQGQQASMLSLGRAGWAKISCEFGKYVDGIDQCPLVQEPNVTLAIERLDGFAFVGLLEEYDLSVCLFHLRFGGDCLPVEFENMRPGEYVSDMKKQAQQVELDLLAEHPDPYDTPVYKAASQRFWIDVAKYEANPRTCSEICPFAADRFRTPQATH